MDWEIAVPSYRRAQTLREKTASLLEKYKISPERVTIFVANEQEKTAYANELAQTPYRKIVVGEAGMGAIRRFIQKHYPEGTLVMNLDDDLSEVLKKKSDKELIPVESLVEDVIERGFYECQKNGAKMFGVYAAANPMFMRKQVSVGLYYCIGSCWGVVSRHSQGLSVTLDDKEDFERTLQHYQKDGCVVRLDDITVRSKYYTEAGGMQVTRTEERIKTSAENLVKRFPHLCTMYIRETTGHAELRLRDSRGEAKPIEVLKKQGFKSVKVGKAPKEVRFRR